MSNTTPFCNRFCPHGELGVTINTANLFDPGSTTSIADLARFSEGNGSIGSNTVTDRLVLASAGDIGFDTNNRIGSRAPDVRDGGVCTTCLYAAGDISMNSNSTIRGILTGARGGIELGNDNGAIDGATAGALGPIGVGNADRATACIEGLETQMNEVRPAGIGGSNLVS